MPPRSIFNDLQRLKIKFHFKTPASLSWSGTKTNFLHPENISDIKTRTSAPYWRQNWPLWLFYPTPEITLWYMASKLMPEAIYPNIKNACSSVCFLTQLWQLLERHQGTSYAANTQVFLEDLPRYHVFLKTKACFAADACKDVIRLKILHIYFISEVKTPKDLKSISILIIFKEAKWKK